MKKLMMILSVALSFGLFADTLPTGVNFEAFSAGAFDFSMTDNGQPLAINDKAYWIYGTDADGTITEEAERYAQGDAPDAWKNSVNEKFLHLDGGLVYRTALSCISEDNERNNIATQAADPDTVVSFGENPVYFDTMVKFTAFEDLPTAMSDADAKLAVFAYAPEDGGYTNLVISGGYVGEGRTFTNYVTDVAVDLSKWYRLTVRALNVGKSGNEPAFLVYLDEELVSRREGDDCGLVAENLNAIGAKNSASIVPSFKTGVEVCAMGFSGTGDIDDLSITDVKPGFIVEESTYTINWSEGVATLKIDDGDAFAVEGSGSTNVALAAGVTAVTITATYADGYERGTWKQGSEPVDGNEFEDVVGAELYIDAMIPLYDIGGKHYASVQDMLAAAKTGDTVKLLADVVANAVFPDEVTEITIDLAGHTITGDVPDSPVISGGAEALVTVINSTEEIGSVVPTYNESSWDEVLAVVSYDVMIYGGIFDGPVTADNLTVVEGGQFYQPEAEAVEDFYLVVGEIVAPEDVTYIGDNYFQVGEAPVPQIKLSWNENEAVMTVLVSIEGGDVTENPAVVQTGDVAEFIVLPKDGYEYATVPDGWFLRIDGGISNNFEVAEESIKVTIPEPTAIPPTTYEVTVAAPYEHSTVSVMGNDKTEYGTTGGVYTISADVAITVSYQADSGYQFVDGAKQLWDFDADSEDKETTAPVVEAIPPTMWTVTFSTNTLNVAEAETQVEDGASLVEGKIPEFVGGTWDVDPTNAVITCNTNFNYTIAAPEPTVWTVTFSTNTLNVAEAETQVEDGASLVEGKIPEFEGGTWDVDPTNAVITCNTNFNYTIAAGKTYPTYIMDHASDELKAKFDEWATNVAKDRDAESLNLDAFLLNCTPANVDEEKAKFVISSIAKDAEGNWVVKVGDKGQDAEYGNGYINIISVKATKFPTAGDDADFFQATLVIEPVVKE